MGGEVIESREEPESEEEERQMEWKITWEDHLTEYLQAFDEVIGGVAKDVLAGVMSYFAVVLSFPVGVTNALAWPTIVLQARLSK